MLLFMVRAVDVEGLGLFVVVYHYKVPIEKTKEYIMLEKRATRVYMEHGCLDVEIFRDAKDPRRWMEINKFRDREHYNEVIGAVDADPRIGPLFEEFMTLFKEEEYQPEKQSYFKML